MEEKDGQETQQSTSDDSTGTTDSFDGDRSWDTDRNNHRLPLGNGGYVFA